MYVLNKFVWIVCNPAALHCILLMAMFYEPGEYFVLWNHIFPVLGEFDTNDVAFRWYVLGGRFSRKREIS